MPGGVGGQHSDYGLRMPKPLPRATYRKAMLQVASHAHDKDDLVYLLWVLDIPMTRKPRLTTDMR